MLMTSLRLWTSLARRMASTWAPLALALGGVGLAMVVVGEGVLVGLEGLLRVDLVRKEAREGPRLCRLGNYWKKNHIENLINVIKHVSINLK